MDLMTRKETAEFLGIPVATLNYWATSYPGKLPYYRIGKRAVYNRKDVEAFVETCKVEAANQ